MLGTIWRLPRGSCSVPTRIWTLCWKSWPWLSPSSRLALEEGKLFDTDDSLDTLLHKLAEDAAGREASFISLYFGEDVQEADAQKAGALFEEVCPGAEVAVLSGGQPVYYYIISME